MHKDYNKENSFVIPTPVWSWEPSLCGAAGSVIFPLVQGCNSVTYGGRGVAVRGATSSFCSLSKVTPGDGSPLWATRFLDMSLQRRLRLGMVVGGGMGWGAGGGWVVS